MKHHSYHFVKEHSHSHKIKVVAVFVLCILLLLGIIVSIQSFSESQGVSFYGNIQNSISYQIHNFTLAGVFYVGFFASLFFSPLPLEVFFYYGLAKGNSLILSFLLIMAGLIPAELLNYYLGYKLSDFMFYLVSIKQVYAAKRWVNKYGAYAIFLFNLVPIFPSPILTFALGVSRYNFTRLFTLLILADVLKFILIILFYHYLGFQLDSFL